MELKSRGFGKVSAQPHTLIMHIFSHLKLCFVCMKDSMRVVHVANLILLYRALRKSFWESAQEFFDLSARILLVLKK